MDGESLDAGTGRKPFRNGPRFQRAVFFQAQVIVKPRRVVAVHNERVPFPRNRLGSWLRCFHETSLRVVRLERLFSLFFLDRLLAFCLPVGVQPGRVCADGFPRVALAQHSLGDGLQIQFCRAFEFLEFLPC